MSEETKLALRDKEQQRIERALARLNGLARLMDDQFELPLVRVRFGLDPLIGLIPGGGDWVSWTVSMYILFEAIRLRVPARVLVGIGWNATADLVLGYAPGIGDVADMVFKANRRSVRLLMNWFEAKQNPRAPDTIDVPTVALDKPKSGPERWLIGIGLVTVFTVLASMPLLLLYWLFSG